MISLVIPAFNEARYLPRLLDTVDVARSRYAALGGTVEVIVADNQSTDDTPRIAESRGCRVAPVAIRNIGAVRNGGIRASTGDVVATVDADHRMHPDTFVVIDRMMADPRIVGGMSGVTMERWSPGIAITYAVIVPIVWLTKVDTGVVFCRRADFEAVGGYDERLPAAEDVMFGLALRRLGGRTGRRLARARSIKVLASTRKFDEHGDWHYFGFLAHTPRLFLRGKLPEHLTRYWYHPDR